MWTVLIVEDEVFVRESVKEIIRWEELGFTVIGESGNGTEALAIITREKPNLVLTDIVMPGLNGIELLKKTREAGLQSKFIMLTCMGEFEYVRQAMEYGASNYILKLSMSVNSLRDTLRKVSAELNAAGEDLRIPSTEGFVKKDDISDVPAIAEVRSSNSESSLPSSISGFQSVLEPVRDLAVTHPEVNKIIDYINGHYDSDITVKSMSRFVMMGENYVSALFKKKTGYTLIHYLHGVRMQKAAHYLRSTDFPVYEIGQKVGFANDNYFIKIFKRWTGCTPSQYRHLP